MPNVTQAIRHMRKKSGLNQQFFATAVNMSTRALTQYEEGTRSPEPKQMLAFYAYASKHQPELAPLFWQAFIGLVEPLPGVTLTTLEKALGQIGRTLEELRTLPQPAQDSFLAAAGQMLEALRTLPEPEPDSLLDRLLEALQTKGKKGAP
jgi:transcriptional regulator with XRE-family HTH domain